MAIVRHIVAGNHDPEVLVIHDARRRKRLSSKRCEDTARLEHLPRLQQARSLYDIYGDERAADASQFCARMPHARRFHSQDVTNPYLVLSRRPVGPPPRVAR
jgi:hypothetical protein